MRQGMTLAPIEVTKVCTLPECWTLIVWHVPSGTTMPLAQMKRNTPPII